MLKWFAPKHILYSLLVLLLALDGEAQVAYHNFNSNDGLPSNEVYSVFQDHQGFMWFATDHGIVKYNGYSFKTYTTADGLTDNTVLAIKGDEDNLIWVLTLSGGMCYFDGVRFQPHPNNDNIKKLFSSCLPTSWLIFHNKQIWFGFVNIGFARVDSNATAFFARDTQKLNDDSVNICILQLKGGKCIYSSFLSHKMSVINDPQVISMEQFRVPFDYSGSNFALIKFTDKKILIGREAYLLYIDSSGKGYHHAWARNNQMNLIREGDNKVWMLQHNGSSYSIKPLKDKICLLDSMTFVSNATDILLDQQGNQWISTLDRGIYIIPNDEVRIYADTHLAGSYKLSSLNNDSRNLYVALPDGRLLKIDRNLKSEICYAGTATSDKSPVAISNISFNADSKVQINLDPSFEWDNGLNLYHTRILQVDDNKFLVGSSNGFALLDNKKRRVFYNSGESGFTKRVTEIYRISAKKYLIGTLNGLYYFECGTTCAIKQEPYLKDYRITAAKGFNNVDFAISTRGGGVFINRKNKFYRITEKDGLVSDLAENLYFENDSVLWIASFKGISKIYFRVQGDSIYTRIKNYTREDGLCSNQVNAITGFNGYIWLATNEGLCYFRAKDLSEDIAVLPLYFGNISVNGIKRPIDSLILTHDENNIFIEFNALYYKAIGGIRYRVRLKGIDPWKFTDLNYIQYFSLPPGEYQFEVAAEDKDGKYKSEVRALKFTIKPRFVDTLLFKGLIGLIGLLIIGLVVSAIFSYQKLKSTNIIKLLQAEFKALSYQINPHFIFNVLNSIQYYILKKDTDNAVHLLGSFALLIRRIVNNSRQQYIGIIEEVECLREYMDLEKMRLDNKFEYTINIDSSIDIEDKNILPMIIQPLVENSIWHGIVPSVKHGIISIDFKKENGTVICKVEDNGVGINTTLNQEKKSQNNLSLAMKNVSERLKIISELNDTTWAIKTEDKSVTDPATSGTIVTIIFPAVKDRT